MNFQVIEGAYADFDSIHDDFVEDYIFSTELTNREIQKKYGLTYSEFKELCDSVKEEFGLTRRYVNRNTSKYYCKSGNGFFIQKTINKASHYIGYVKTEDEAMEIVEKCKNVAWDIAECKKIMRDYNECAV